MDKKELKLYESPVMETVVLSAPIVLQSASNPGEGETGAGGGDEEITF